MAKQYPKNENLILMLAEDIRQEVGGKLTILGFAGANHLKIPKNFDVPKDALMAIPLNFLFQFTDGLGKFSSKIIINDPNGTPLLESALMPAEKVPDGYMQIILKVPQFVFKDTGTFECIVDLDGAKQYSKKFSIGWSEA